MTHEYTILLGGRIHTTPWRPRADDRPGTPPPAAGLTAIAWAEDTVLAVGSDASVSSVSRGDSRFVELHGAHVVPLAGTLEPGSSADLEILAADLADSTPRVVAVVRGGRVVEGALP